jgi:hypothetical protein
MTLDELTKRIDHVIDRAIDPEDFHGAEDDLMKEWITKRAGVKELEQWQRLWDGDFIRWYA